ncbi:MAG: amidohydrolase family protein, partial [Planctomycetaceae bacterium]|nr:amidohydrolase family protein [Planctomycetaceae bacterium]
MFGILRSRFIPTFALTLCLTLGFTSAEDSKQRFTPGYVPGWKAITNATIVLSDSETLEQSTILIRNGRIEKLGQNIELPPGTALFDAAGNFVYPAFVDAGCSLLIPEKPDLLPSAGLSVDTSTFAWGGTPPDHRKGLTPEFEAVSRIDLSEPKLDLFRHSGIGLIQALPRGRILNGWGTTLYTRGGSLREAVRNPQSAPVAQFFRLAPDDVYPATVMGSIAHVRQFFLDAEHHRLQEELHQTNPEKISPPKFDPAYKQAQRIIAEKHPVVLIADTRDEIERALDFGAEHQLPIIIWGGREADRSTSRLKDTAAKVIWTFPTEDKPNFDPPADKPDEVIPGGKLPLDFPPKRVQERQLQIWNERWEVPAKLLQAGIPVALSSHGLKEPKDFLKQARELLEHTLSPEELFILLTADTGKFFGPSEASPIQVGNPAKLVVLNGSLKEKTSVVRKLLIDDWEQEFDVPPHVPIETKNPDEKNADDNKTTEPSPQLPDLTGDWTLNIKNGDDTSKAKLTLTQIRAELSGKFESDQGNGRVASGTVAADKFDFNVLIGAGDRALELHFSGTPIANQSDTWTGSLTSKFGTATWTAKRIAPPPPKSSPIQLSLETDPEPAPETAPSPATDQSPSETSTQSTAGVTPTTRQELPTELDTDRRPFSTDMPQDILIRGGRVWTGERELPQADILIRDGKIVALEPTLAAVEGVPELDAHGLFVMPGIIDTHSHIMISDNFDDINEFTLSVVPEVSIRDVVWTDDVSEYRALAGGVTTARLLHGSANVIGGQHAVVKLRLGKTAREHLIPDAPGGVKFALGENVKSTEKRFPNSRMGIEAVIIRALQEARRYRLDWERYESKIKVDPSLAKQLPPRKDLRLEALRGVLDQSIRIHSHCYRADEILMLIRVADSFGIRVASLQHVLEGYKVAPEIAAHGASCSTFSDWWAFKMEAYDAIPHNPALLRQAGVNICIKSDDWELIRNLNQEASKTVRYGLSVDDALRTITVNPARELGLQDRIGMLKVGFDGD